MGELRSAIDADMATWPGAAGLSIAHPPL